MLSITLAFFISLVALNIEARAVSDSRKEKMGNAEARIIGGTMVTKGEFPYVVSIKDMSSGIPLHFCGGVILNEEHILTSATCMANVNPGMPSSIVVVAGELDLTIAEETEQIIPVVGIYNHDQFNFFTLQNDIAILSLFEPLTFNLNVRAVFIPQSPVEPAEPYCTTVGWGANSAEGPTPVASLYKVQLPYMSDEDCNSVYGGQVTNSMICFGGDGGDTCQGDLGGPVLCGSAPLRELQGITSWGAATCGTSGLPTVFTQVAHYLQWIENHS